MPSHLPTPDPDNEEPQAPVNTSHAVISTDSMHSHNRHGHAHLQEHPRHQLEGGVYKVENRTGFVTKPKWREEMTVGKMYCLNDVLKQDGKERTPQAPLNYSE